MMQVRDTELPGCSTDHPPPYQCYELPRETRPGCSTGLPPPYKCYELPSYSELYDKEMSERFLSLVIIHVQIFPSLKGQN